MTASYFVLCPPLNGLKLQHNMQTLLNARISPSEAKGSDTLPTSAPVQCLCLWHTQDLCGLLCPALQGRPHALYRSSSVMAHPEIPQKFVKILSSQTVFFRWQGVDPRNAVWPFAKLKKLWHLKKMVRRFFQKYFFFLSPSIPLPWIEDIVLLR